MRKLNLFRQAHLSGQEARKCKEKGDKSMFRAITITATIAIILASMITLTGCFSSHSKDIEAFLKPQQTQVTADKYIMQPPDEIEVHCASIPQIDKQRQRIRPDGKIGFEGVGEFVAAGKTPLEMASSMREQMSKLYTLIGDNPIEVRIITYRSKVYYVLGQVQKPGPKLFSGRDTVLSAISEANPEVTAWLDRIQIIRPSADASVRPKIFEVNFDRMSAHGDNIKKVPLQEGDIIYVPPTVMAAIALKLEEFLRPIARAFTGAYMVQSAGNSSVSGYGSGI
jgi:protein involved in polysaccharide export with SLBB domain